jgi:hypothetical protein
MCSEGRAKRAGSSCVAVGESLDASLEKYALQTTYTLKPESTRLTAIYAFLTISPVHVTLLADLRRHAALVVGLASLPALMLIL